MTNSGWLKNSSFEVLTKDNNRWTIDAPFSKKYAALERAGELVASGDSECVRVVEVRQGDDEEHIIFEETVQLRAKPLKINPIKETTICQALADYYDYPARRSMGRLFRAYLDEQGMTALELLFDSGYLVMLERTDTYYVNGVRHVGSLQSKIIGEKPGKRTDDLYRTFERIREQARDREEITPYSRILANKGIDQARRKIARDVSDENRYFYTYGMLAAYLGKGSPAHKLSMMMVLADMAKDEGSLDLIDGVMAEIIDGHQGLLDIFGDPPSPINAWQMYIQVLGGNYKAQRASTVEIQRLNRVFAVHDLPLTKAVLLGHVARGLRGFKPLSRDGRNVDREKFNTLLQQIIEPTGILGGSKMSEAVILRAKILLGEDGDDLPIETALRQIIYMLPSNAARLGMMLDLTGTSIGIKYQKVLRVQLGLLLGKLSSVTDLFPANIDETTRHDYLDALRQRVGLSALPDELKAGFAASLDKIAGKKNNNLPTETETSSDKQSKVVTETETAAPQNKKVDDMDNLMSLKSGEVLFCEGDEGNNAYLILNGTIEIYRTAGEADINISNLGKGEIIGEMSLIDNQPRMASARALTNVKLAGISQDDLSKRLKRLKRDDKVIHHVMKTLVRRLRGFAIHGE